MATRKQKAAIAILSENIGIPVGEAMRRAGYSEVTANTPARLTESEAFKSIAEQIPDDRLVEVHIEGLKATSARFTPEGELIKVPDYATRHKYLESGYKLKKVLDGEGVNININAVEVSFRKHEGQDRG
jgi:hypothetical protein